MPKFARFVGTSARESDNRIVSIVYKNILAGGPTLSIFYRAEPARRTMMKNIWLRENRDERCAKTFGMNDEEKQRGNKS
jgi:hypothetical protein